jgi:hypothetical protein
MVTAEHEKPAFVMQYFSGRLFKVAVVHATLRTAVRWS